MSESPENQNKNTLRLVTLNIWGGKLYPSLMRFIKQHSRTVDFFCLQEVFNSSKSRLVYNSQKVVPDIFGRLKIRLPEHQGFFCEEQQEGEGEAVFTRRSLGLTHYGEIFIHRWKNAGLENPKDPARALQLALFHRNGTLLTIAQFHGLYSEQGKVDTPERIAQSKKIKQFLDTVPGPKILCGDFNLLPNTTSLAILEEGMRNLIRVNNITSTRNFLYPKAEKFADYILVSPEVEVLDFRVLPHIVSDHQPLFLEFR